MDGGSGSHGNGHRGLARAASDERRLRLSRVQWHRCLTRLRPPCGQQGRGGPRPL